MLMTILLLLASGFLLVFAMTMAINLLIFPKLRPEDEPQAQPLISILIPARNEADVIERTVRHILAQHYQQIEVLILDDHSEDGTGDLALQAAAGDERLRVLQGDPLPSGWVGKSWACHTLAQHATGDILVFTDADVIWQPAALDTLMAQMQAADVDMITVWSTQITETWTERLTVPCIALAIIGYLPTVLVHHTPFSTAAAANGQAMGWRRSAYEAIGGHTVVANTVLDDVTLAKAVKKNGYRMRMVDGNGQILTRMYEDWQSVRDGFAKNILAGYGGLFQLLLGALLHWLIFWVPWVALLMPDYRLWGLSLIVLGFCLRAISAAFTRQRVLDTLGMPLSVLLFTIISAKSIYWHYTGGPVWKGRTLGKDNDQWNKPPSSSAAASADS